MPENPFTSLDLPKRHIPARGSRYRVYKNAKEFSMVEATNALQALQASGLEQAYRIERESLQLDNVLTCALSKDEVPAPPMQIKEEAPIVQEVAAPPPPPEIIAQAAPPPEPVKKESADAPLSGEEVDKLLKG